MKHSPRVEQLIEAFSCLPGVGRRSAQRMTYALLERDRAGGERLAETLSEAMQGVGQCRRCRNFAEDELCPVCADPGRDQQLVCVVASPADVLAIEQSGEYQGRYFVLMGHLSPIDGLGPSEVGLDQLEQQLADGEVGEIILALGTTVEGEATAHYVRELAGERITVTRIAQGVPMGGDLEFVDGATLAQALRGRTRLGES